jgi:hypothetical protein
MHNHVHMIDPRYQQLSKQEFSKETCYSVDLRPKSFTHLQREACSTTETEQSITSAACFDSVRIDPSMVLKKLHDRCIPVNYRYIGTVLRRIVRAVHLAHNPKYLGFCSYFR